ncbi:uncharacterized protein LOC118348523 [Juglans regia]|uniref:Uncharacterized protein LOC118348523 n=1 Tax=Juglans regia TaxID=51240 RepID=A0A6P9EFV9_JUGRE|nr:uncharacterized protein LOC118348523 [Juglans regia]
MGESKSNEVLGFRDFEYFNKAMLAKQFRRMLKQPNSLVDKVQQLIDIEDGVWKKDQTSDTFNSEEAKTICDIPLSKWETMDRLKAAHNLLPTKLNLFKKQITEFDCCPICEREPETIMHVAWSCPAALDVWAENDSPMNKWYSSDVVFVDLWGKLNAFLKEEEVEVVACIMRKIWMRRNSLLFEKKFDHPRTIIFAATQGLRDFKLAQDQLQKTPMQGNAE